MVDRILCAAYVDDLSCNEFQTSLVTYFIHAYNYNDKIHLMKNKIPYIRNPNKLGRSEEDINLGISNLSSTKFDMFFKKFAQCLNLQISQYVNQVLEFCRFYLKSWVSLDKDHVKELNINLPKEEVNDKFIRTHPPIDKTHQEIHKLQKTNSSGDDSLIQQEEPELISVTQLGRTLTQWGYRVKSKIATFQLKSNQKVFFQNSKWQMIIQKL